MAGSVFTYPISIVVRTDVQSAGREKTISHLPWQSAKYLSPKVVRALNLRALSLNRGKCMVVQLIFIF